MNTQPMLAPQSMPSLLLLPRRTVHAPDSALHHPFIEIHHRVLSGRAELPSREVMAHEVQSHLRSLQDAGIPLRYEKRGVSCPLLCLFEERPFAIPV